MRKVYICSPYRAKDEFELDRNIEYAQSLTKIVLKNDGDAPITPHLYMTQVLNDKIPDDRKRGMEAGLELLKICDRVLVGTAYGISEGMRREINTAKQLGIEIVKV